MKCLDNFQYICIVQKNNDNYIHIENLNTFYALSKFFIRIQKNNKYQIIRIFPTIDYNQDRKYLQHRYSLTEYVYYNDVKYIPAIDRYFKSKLDEYMNLINLHSYMMIESSENFKSIKKKLLNKYEEKNNIFEKDCINIDDSYSIT
jgi:hypothetical protein